MKENEYEKFKYSVGTRLQTYRQNNSISQEKFAELVGCSTTYISYIENGRNKCPAWLIYEYATRLGVSANALLGIDMVDLDIAPDCTSPTKDKLEKILPKLDDEHLSLLLSIATLMYKDLK